ncbi:hypothetical protein OAF75_02220 [Verrucomicrobiales bacterium]|nr:hypothetical protein [Verrucomicrobiales bacterium]
MLSQFFSSASNAQVSVTSVRDYCILYPVRWSLFLGHESLFTVHGSPDRDLICVGFTSTQIRSQLPLIGHRATRVFAGVIARTLFPGSPTKRTLLRR